MSIKKDVTEEVEFSDEENRGQTRLYEDDILGGLLAAASFHNSCEETYPVEIVRNGAVVLKFDIRPLSDDEYATAKEHNSKYARNKNLGIKYVESTNTMRYRSELLYTATVPEDKEKLWNNKDAWSKLNVLSGIDLIGAVLKAGEKAAVLSLIDRISGYDITLEETAKN